MFILFNEQLINLDMVYSINKVIDKDTQHYALHLNMINHPYGGERQRYVSEELLDAAFESYAKFLTPRMGPFSAL